jgi:hypothetical protein
MLIEWSAAGYTDKLAVLNMNMNSDYSCTRWILNDANIKGFKSLCVDNESLEKKRKLARDYINAVLRTALKTHAALHECSMLRIALKKGKLVTRYINALCFASH